MRKLFLAVFLLYSVVFSQQVTVINTVQLTTPSDASFYYPQFSPDDSKIIFTSESYKGIWLYDMKTERIVQLNNDMGAGYEPLFSLDGASIIYRADNYSNLKRYSSLVIQNLITGEIKIIESNVRDLSAPKIFLTSGPIYFKNNSLYHFDLNRNTGNYAEINDIRVISIQNSQILLSVGQEKKVLEPMGKGNYIWSSISPDGEKILFTLAGKGTFISDLQGKIITEIGYANAPKWSPDGKWIVFMVDYDDGHQITGSEIYIASADGKDRIQLTNTQNIIEMYPDWSHSQNELIFNSSEGVIYVMLLKFD